VRAGERLAVAVLERAAPNGFSFGHLNSTAPPQLWHTTRPSTGIGSPIERVKQSGCTQRQ
jgi:hypothetical protein